MNVMKITPWSALTICWKEQNAGGDWPEMLLLAGIICSLASGIRPAQPCALPILPNSLFQTCGINPSAKASCGHRALFPKRLVQELFDGSPPAMEIREPSSDRFHFFFFKTKLKIRTSYYRHCVSKPPHSHLLPCCLSLCCLLFPS